MKSHARIAWIVLLTAAGCMSTPEQDKMFRHEIDRESGLVHLASYLKDVGLDFADIFTIDVAAGKAGPYLVQAEAYATKYLAAGLGSWSGYKAGLLGRAFGVWREERHLGALGGFAVGPVQNYYVDVCRIPYCGTPTLADKQLIAHGYDIDLDEYRHWADIGASLHVVALGADVAVSPYEAIDFLKGLFANYPNPDWLVGSDMPWDIGIDLADDDTRPSLYDDHLGRYRANDYSVWPTIWPTTFGVHREAEGEEEANTPYRGPETGSFGGAFGGTHGTHH